MINDTDIITDINDDLKTCTKCGLAFPRTKEFFHNHKHTKDGLNCRCKECAKQVASQWHKDNPEQHAQRCREYAEKNPEKLRENYKRWIAIPENREKSNARARERYQKIKGDEIYKLHNAASRAVRDSLYSFGGKQDKSCLYYIGLNELDLYLYLTRDGEIEVEGKHVDHIIPKYLAKNREEAIAINHWTNLRLIPAEQNLKKNRFLPSIFEIPVNIHRLALELYYREKKKQASN